MFWKKMAQKQYNGQLLSETFKDLNMKHMEQNFPLCFKCYSPYVIKIILLEAEKKPPIISLPISNLC